MYYIRHRKYNYYNINSEQSLFIITRVNNEVHKFAMNFV